MLEPDPMDVIKSVVVAAKALAEELADKPSAWSDAYEDLCAALDLMDSEWEKR